MNGDFPDLAEIIDGLPDALVAAGGVACFVLGICGFLIGFSPDDLHEIRAFFTGGGF